MKHFSQRLTLEALEDRRLLATCHVVRLGDFGAGADLGGGQSRGDLRYCINKANDLPGHDTIDLNVTGTINLTGPLPDLSSDMDIVGPVSGIPTVKRGSGGEYRIFTVTATADVRISRVKVTGGSTNDGGGIHNQGTLALFDSQISGNKAGHGGGIYSNGTLTLFDTQVSANTAGSGGGIYNTGTLLIQNSIVSNNVVKLTNIPGFPSVFGGGIYNSNLGAATIQYSTIAGNKAECTGPDYPGAFGGGIFGGSLNIAYSTISGNTATASGHDPYATGGGIAATDVTIANSVVFGNVVSAGGDAESSGSWGGGINATTLTIGNSTIANNNQYGYGGGGGIYAGGFASATTITNSTIAGNSEGIRVIGPLTLRNSIVANSTDGLDLNGTITNSGYNLIGDSTGGSGYVPSDLLDIDPMLDALSGNNGGPTLTMALLPGSPAIDSGTNQGAPEWDQRGPGFPRIVNGTIDRGAFEVQATGAPPIWCELAVLITAELETEAQ